MAFQQFHSAGTYLVKLHYISNLQVQIILAWLNFVGIESQIICPFMDFLIEWFLAKNRIEFQWGSKLPWTTSEALYMGTCDVT